MKPRTSVGLTLSVWGACVLLHAWYYVASILASEDIPDAYARAWDFQLLMFGLFRLPFWLLVLAVALWIFRFTKRRPHAV
jgi:hypothetical protein